MLPLTSVQIIVTDPGLYESPPSYATEGSAAFDLRSSEDFVLRPGETKIVSSGMRIWHGNTSEGRNWVGLVFARSGLGVKGLVIGNGTGVIDSDYQGALNICLYNRLPSVSYATSEWRSAPRENVDLNDIVVKRGDRVAQYAFLPVSRPELHFVEAFDSTTVRGEGGFGSTGR